MVGGRMADQFLTFSSRFGDRSLGGPWQNGAWPIEGLMEKPRLDLIAKFFAYQGAWAPALRMGDRGAMARIVVAMLRLWAWGLIRRRRPSVGAGRGRRRSLRQQMRGGLLSVLFPRRVRGRPQHHQPEDRELFRVAAVHRPELARRRPSAWRGRRPVFRAVANLSERSRCFGDGRRGARARPARSAPQSLRGTGRGREISP